MKTPHVLVTPTHLRNGNTAPSIAVEVNKSDPNYEQKAIDHAKEKSRLGDFPNDWGFVVK